MREIDHPNLLKLYEVFETENSIYMIMNLLEGGQLLQKVKKVRVYPEKEVLPYNII